MVRQARQLLCGWPFWLVVGVVALVLASGWLWRVRERAIAELSSRQSRAAWNQWKEYTRQTAQAGGPVARRAVQTDEPPTLVLLRDHFAAVLICSLVLLGALLGFVGFVVRGMLRGGGAS